MKIIKSGVEFNTDDLYSNIDIASTITLINELAILERNYNKIVNELEKRAPSIKQERDKIKSKK